MRETSLQPYELMLYLYAGLILGALAELNGLITGSLKKRLLRGITDSLTAVLGVAVSALAFYLANGGSFRLFGLMGMCLGALLFRRTLGVEIRSFVNKSRQRFSSR